MKETELTRLIRRYYPKSIEGRKRHYRLVNGRELNEPTASERLLDQIYLNQANYDSNWVWGIGAILVALASCVIALLINIVTGLPVVWPWVAADVLWVSFVVTIILAIGWTFSDGLQGGPGSDYLYGCKLKCAWYWRGLLKDILSRPPTPAVILATIEAIEAEAERRQGYTLSLIREREASLEQHRGRLRGVLSQITDRLSSGVAADKEFLTQSRQLEAEQTLDKLSRDLGELQVQKQLVFEALKPAQTLAAQLRQLYADANEVEVISRAKGAVDSESFGASQYQQDLLAYYRQTAEAETNLAIVAEEVSSRLQAEREIEELLGIAESRQTLKA